MTIVVVSAAVGRGRREARIRQAGLGLVVALIAAIQLSHLWSDGFVTRPWAPCSPRWVGWGLVGALEARRLEYAQQR